MALSPKRKQVLFRELRDLVFRACAGGGGLLGIVYAVHHWNTRPAKCKGGSDALAGCASHTLTAGIISFLVPVFVGMTAGMLVGVLLASRIRPRGRSRSRSRRSVTCASAPIRNDQSGEVGHWLAARYHGHCDDCRTAITPGDRIRHFPGGNLCERCGAVHAGRQYADVQADHSYVVSFEPMLQVDSTIRIARVRRAVIGIDRMAYRSWTDQQKCVCITTGETAMLSVPLEEGGTETINYFESLAGEI